MDSGNRRYGGWWIRMAVVYLVAGVALGALSRGRAAAEPVVGIASAVVGIASAVVGAAVLIFALNVWRAVGRSTLATA